MAPMLAEWPALMERAHELAPRNLHRPFGAVCRMAKIIVRDDRWVQSAGPTRAIYGVTFRASCFGRGGQGGSAEGVVPEKTGRPA